MGKINEFTVHVVIMFCGCCEIAIQNAVCKITSVKMVKTSKLIKEVTEDNDSAIVTSDEIINTIDNMVT